LDYVKLICKAEGIDGKVEEIIKTGLPQIPNLMLLNAKKGELKETIINVNEVNKRLGEVFENKKFDENSLIVNDITNYLFKNYPVVLTKNIDDTLRDNLITLLNHAVMYDIYVKGRFKEEGKPDVVDPVMPGWAWGILGFLGGMFLGMVLGHDDKKQ